MAMNAVATEDHLAFLIHLAAKRLRLEFARRAAEFDLTPSTARGLAFLQRRPGASLKALAEALEVQPMSVVRVVDDLESRGLVRRAPDPRDRRALSLTLTPAGEAAVRRIWKTRPWLSMTVASPSSAAVRRIWKTLDAIIGEACGGMSPAEHAGLARGLKAFVEGMDGFVAAGDAP